MSAQGGETMPDRPMTNQRGEPEAKYAGRWVAARVAAGYRTDVSARTHTVSADEPIPVGGSDAGMTPHELFLASLGSCMAMTMRMYADRKQWPLESASVQLRTAPSRDPDHDVHLVGSKTVTRLERRIDLVGPLTEEQRRRIVEIADRCPVKRTIEGGVQIIGVE